MGGWEFDLGGGSWIRFSIECGMEEWSVRG